MIDPKRLELGMYEDIPHLLTPVVVDPKKAANALRWAVREMEERYKTLAAEGVRNIEQYNRNIRHRARRSAARPNDPEAPKPLPFIVVVIDELADLMMVAEQRGRGIDLPPGADGARRRHPPDPGDAAAVGRRHHRPHQGQPAVAHLVPRVVEDRLAHDSRRQRRRAAARQGRHAVPAAGLVALHPPARAVHLRTGERAAGQLPAQAGQAGVRRRRSPPRTRRAGPGGIEFEKDELYDEAARIVVQQRAGVDLVPAAQAAHRLQPRGAAGGHDGGRRAGVGRRRRQAARGARRPRATSRKSMRSCARRASPSLLVVALPRRPRAAQSVAAGRRCTSDALRARGGAAPGARARTRRRCPPQAPSLRRVRALVGAYEDMSRLFPAERLRRQRAVAGRVAGGRCFLAVRRRAAIATARCGCSRALSTRSPQLADARQVAPQPRASKAARAPRHRSATRPRRPCGAAAPPTASRRQRHAAPRRRRRRDGAAAPAAS